MIRDITIGQYYPAKSVLHRLDPRTKFLGTLGFLISVFLFHTFLGYAVATAFLVAMIAISKVPVKFMFKGLKAIVMILLITVVFNIILDAWRSAVAFRDHQCHKGRPCSCRKNGDPSCLPCDRIFHHDIDYHAESADRWSGETAPSAEQDPGAGT